MARESDETGRQGNFVRDLGISDFLLFVEVSSGTHAIGLVSIVVLFVSPKRAASETC